MSDYSLRQNILDQLEFEPSIDANDIGVTVEDGIVTLTGHVGSYSQKTAVETLVGRIKGVKGLAQDIQVRLAGTEGTSDEEIAKRAVSLLTWSSVVPEGRVQVRVQDGWITLTGALDWNYEKTAAADALTHVKGVVGITNEIAINPRVSRVDVKTHIEDALKRDAHLDAKAIRVRVSGSTVVLEGSVTTWGERRSVEQAAWSTPGVTTVDNRLTVR